MAKGEKLRNFHDFPQDFIVNRFSTGFFSFFSGKKFASAGNLLSQKQRQHSNNKT
jgi:hypothetical protein